MICCRWLTPGGIGHMLRYAPVDIRVEATIDKKAWNLPAVGRALLGAGR